MTAFSASTCERLASELEAADRDLPVAKWEVATSNSFRRINGPDARDGGVLHAVVQRDGHPDLSMSEEKLRQLSWLRNSAPEVAAALRSAVAEVERLSTRQQELLATIVRVTNETPFPDEAKDALAQRGKLVAEIGTLRTRLAALESLCEEACKVADGLVDFAAPGLDAFRDLAVTDIADIRNRLAAAREAK